MHMYKRQSSLPQYYRQSSLYERQSSDEDSTGSGPIHCTGAGPVRGNKPIHCAHNKPVRLDRVVRSCSVLGHLSSTTSSPSPETSAVSSPFCMRRRRTQTHCSLDELLSTSPPAHQALLLRQPSCVARDPIQPTSGTLNSSTEQVNDDEEEERDNFCAVARQRSSTCPESRAWKRRLKVRAERRPASPPPCDVHVSLLSQQLSSISIKEQLSIPDRDLPNLNEETADRDFPHEEIEQKDLQNVIEETTGPVLPDVSGEVPDDYLPNLGKETSERDPPKVEVVDTDFSSF